MKKIRYILPIIMLLIIDAFVICAYLAMNDPIHYKSYYEYKSIDGQIGRSSFCYTIEDGRDFCRDVKKIYRVVEYKKVKERKN